MSLTSTLVYDGDCPVCCQYVRYLRLRDAVGPVELVSARESHPVVHRLKQDGYDLNEGIAFVRGGTVYYGKDCVTHLALLSTPVGAFNRVNAAIFSSERASAVLYPILKLGRKLLLFMLRRKPI
ncbi:MAG: DCC1-like thiol-disulfide oxidoreductase family protein [Pseudomonadota bacterium]